MNEGVLLSARGLCKRFGGVRAVENVSFDLYKSEIVGLVGDNGAGKSTLIQIVSGVYKADKGELFWEGQAARFPSPREARLAGIETIYQDLSLAEDLDIAANIFLGKELMRKSVLGALGFLDNKKMKAEALRVLDHLEIQIPSIHTSVRRLSGGQRQSAAISRGVYWNAKLIIMDEPTAALGTRERNRVLTLIKNLKRRGIAVILISHNLKDIFAVTERVIVMSRGRKTGEAITAETTEDELLRMMIGMDATTEPVQSH
jgi:ABC-type sugar transport system ATPase subunit